MADHDCFKAASSQLKDDIDGVWIVEGTCTMETPNYEQHKDHFVGPYGFTSIKNGG